MKRGWFKDSWRHALAAKGIKTNKYYAPRRKGIASGPAASTTAFGRGIEGGLTRMQQLKAQSRDKRISQAQEGELRKVAAKEQVGREIIAGKPLTEAESAKAEQLIRVAKKDTENIPSDVNKLYVAWDKERHGRPYFEKLKSATSTLESRRDVRQKSVDDIKDDLKENPANESLKTKRARIEKERDKLQRQIEANEAKLDATVRLFKDVNHIDDLRKLNDVDKKLLNEQVSATDQGLVRTVRNVASFERRQAKREVK